MQFLQGIAIIDCQHIHLMCVHAAKLQFFTLFHNKKSIKPH